MISVLSKPMDQIGPDDIRELIDSEVPEGDQIEFKEALSTRDGSPDRWVAHQDGIGDRARNEILEEAVAFANAYGGALVLGIAESETRPPVGASISPIPRCADFVERLKLVFRDCVDPQIPRVEIFAVPTEDDGSGVVIIRTGRSRMAPHRVKPTRKCPIRRADRCEEMSMREIQELTLNLSRGMERLERLLAERSELFQQEFKCLSDPDNAFGIRMTAMPVSDEIRIDRVYSHNSVVQRFHEPWRTVLDGQGNPLDDDFGIVPIVWRPMVRAARADSNQGTSDTNHDLNIYMEVHCDGLIEIGFVSVPVNIVPNESRRIFLPESLPIDMMANLMVQSHCVRNQVGVPMMEYAIEIEICARREAILMINARSIIPLGSIVAGSKRFPKYSFGSPDEALSLLSLFRRDFWNLLGQDIGDSEDELVIKDWPT